MKKLIQLTAKIVATVIAILFLYEQVMEMGLNGVISNFLSIEGYWVYIGLAVCLSFLNWSFEIDKWRMLTVDFSQFSMKQAAKPVMSGLAMNMVVPFTFGDILMRLMGSRCISKSAKAIFLNRMTSLTVTILFGMVGLLYYFNPANDLWIQSPFAGVFFVMIVLTLCATIDCLYFKKKVMTWTFLRYMVFAIQYFLLLLPLLMGLEWVVILAGISWIFLVRTVVPSFLGAIGIREASTVAFFALWMDNSTVLIIPSLLIWIINIVIPSLIGFCFFWSRDYKLA